MQAPEPADGDLVVLFLERRDEGAFRALYRRHAPAMHAMLRRLLGAQEAEDALQESWLRAARGLRGFRGKSALRTWLMGIALNRSRELLRGRGRWDEPPAEGVGPTADGGLKLDVDRAVDRLPPGYRAVLLLHDAWGYTHSEIARMLDIEEGTSKSQLAHARRAARAWLSGREARR